MTSNSKRWLAVAAVIALSALTGCGGGSSGDASAGASAAGSGGSGGSGSAGASGSSGGSSGSGAPPIDFAAAAGKTAVVGMPVDVRPVIALSGITSCTVKPGSPNAQLFVDVGFTVDDVSCAIGGTPQTLLPPTEFTITATAAAGTEDAQVTLAVTLPRSTFAFVAQHGLDSIAAYSLDPTTGEMSLAGVTPTGEGSRPRAAIADPERRFLYVANSGTAEIARYAIDAADGTLTALPPTPSPGAPFELAIDPVGRFLFVLHGNGNHVLRSYRIDSSDGSLTAADEMSTNAEPLALAIDNTGRFLYAASYGGFFRVAVNQTTGQLSRTTSILLAGALAFPPSNRGVYAALMQTQAVFYYPVGDIANAREVKRSSTALPFNTLVFDPEGRFLYATLSASSRVESFTVDPQTDELAAAGSITLPAGCNPEALSVDPGGRFVRAACSDSSGKIFTLAVDRADGALTLASELSAGSAAAPKSIETVSLRDRFLYAADASNDELDVYSIHASSGALEAGAAPEPVQTAPAALTVDRTGTHLYAVATDGSIDAFAIDAAAGELSPVGGSINGGHVGASLVIDPAGRFAYAPNRAANSISRYGVDPSTGALGVRTDLPVVTSPNGIAFHPSGRYAYVISDGAQWWVTMYDVDPATGALIPFALTPSFSLLAPPTAIVVDPTGRFVYLGLGGGYTVASFTVDPDGSLDRTWQALNGGVSFGYPARSLSVDATGRYLYVASSSTGELAVFGIERGHNAADPGELTLLDGRALSGVASSLRLDLSGRALYAALDSGSPALAVLTVDRAANELDGELPTAISTPAASIAIAP